MPDTRYLVFKIAVYWRSNLIPGFQRPELDIRSRTPCFTYLGYTCLVVPGASSGILHHFCLDQIRSIELYSLIVFFVPWTLNYIFDEVSYDSSDSSLLGCTGY